MCFLGRYLRLHLAGLIALLAGDFIQNFVFVSFFFFRYFQRNLLDTSGLFSLLCMALKGFGGAEESNGAVGGREGRYNILSGVKLALGYPVVKS